LIEVSLKPLDYE